MVTCYEASYHVLLRLSVMCHGALSQREVSFFSFQVTAYFVDAVALSIAWERVLHFNSFHLFEVRQCICSVLSVAI